MDASKPHPAKTAAETPGFTKIDPGVRTRRAWGWKVARETVKVAVVGGSIKKKKMFVDLAFFVLRGIRYEMCAQSKGVDSEAEAPQEKSRQKPQSQGKSFRSPESIPFNCYSYAMVKPSYFCFSLFKHFIEMVELMGGKNVIQ